MGQLNLHGGLVRAGGLAHPSGTRDPDEPGHSPGIVSHSPGHHLQAVLVGGQRVAQDRLEVQVVVRARGREHLGRRGGRGARHVDGLGQTGVHPAAALGPRMRVGGDGAHILQARPRPGRQDEGDGHRHLRRDDQRRPGDEVVQGGVDPALDGVLDGDHGGPGTALTHAIQGGGHVLAGVEHRIRGCHLPQGRLAEGARGTEEGPAGTGGGGRGIGGAGGGHARRISARPARPVAGLQGEHSRSPRPVEGPCRAQAR